MDNTIADLSSALQTYLVAPLNAFGLGGYLFDVAIEEKAYLAADITDHYTESNKALQDHIAIKPKRITLKGLVGEVVYQGAHTGSPALAQVAQKLTIINAFLPTLSAAAIQAQNVISGSSSAGSLQSAFNSAIPAAANIYSLVQNAIGLFNGNTKKQASAYQYFASCQSQGILMGIQTPWEFLTNMAIDLIEAVQPEESLFFSEFMITFKQIRIASTSTVTASSALTGTGGTPPPGGPTGQGANAIQSAPVTNLGSNPSAVLPANYLSGSQSLIAGGSSLKSIGGIANLFEAQ